MKKQQKFKKKTTKITSYNQSDSNDSESKWSHASWYNKTNASMCCNLIRILLHWLNFARFL